MTAAPVPVLLVTGFLGAGKTTVVNQLLQHAGGRRIAAVVNDFGSINIDAELIAGASDGVVSLSNGCICCSLEGDLLRTLATILRRDPRPEHIVIETSGVADPAEVVRNLLDPVVFREAPLETVLCVVDAAAPPASLDDPLLRAQLRSADLVALSKTDLAEPAAAARIREAVRALRPAAVVMEAPEGRLPPALLFPPDPDAPHPDGPLADGPASQAPGGAPLDGSAPESFSRNRSRRERLRGDDVGPDGAAAPRRPRRHPAADRFETLSWTSPAPLSLPLLQAAIGRLAPRLARAKGLFEAVEQPGRQFLFQLAGGRATLVPAGTPAAGRPRARIVFIAELGVIPPEELRRTMEACTVPVLGE
ncbi:CobW family GTP-binding protein [Roseomonas elaeocarpi]|uniref:CobW family GTP-binding protein n=1 Tax=Roseomonas elaeocarpi TaxID=907779 RepID=A0ABV6JYP9_9PROT